MVGLDDLKDLFQHKQFYDPYLMAPGDFLEIQFSVSPRCNNKNQGVSKEQ